MSPSQNTRLFFNVDRWESGLDVTPTAEFIKRKLADVLHGRNVDSSQPPPIDLLCKHSPKVNTLLIPIPYTLIEQTLKTKRPRSINEPALRHFIFSGRRNAVARSIATSHPHIPVHSHPSIFPLYNPSSVDVVVFWEIPQQNRSGHILVPGITFGIGHAALKEIIEDAEGAKVKRSIYAETQREKEEILDAVRASEWNAEMNPITVAQTHEDALEHNFSDGCVSYLHQTRETF